MAVRRQLRELVDLPLREEIEAALDGIPKVRPGEIEDLREEIAALASRPGPDLDGLSREIATMKADLARLMTDVQASTAAFVAVRGEVEAARAAVRDARLRTESATKAVSDVESRLSALRES
jgi:hypothetical protein